MLRHVALHKHPSSFFLEKNPNRDLLKQFRDSKGGIFKVIDAAIFGFLLFSPALPIIPTMKQPAVVLILWVIIVLIMWCKLEYAHRAEVWFICLCRGIILDFPKTYSLKGWLCQKPIFLAMIFLLLFGAVTYVGLDPNFYFEKPEYVWQAALAISGLAFVLMLTKGFVDLEGAPQLLTLNLFINGLADPDLLRDKGFAVVHFTRLQSFVAQHNRGDASFSWNHVHTLSSTEDDKESFSLIAGIRMFLFLHPFRDSDS